jgi:RHS repeat-associated protein
VDNGRGGHITFSYRSTTNAAAVQPQEPVKGRAHLPAPSQVVSQISVDAGFGTPAMVTRYTYSHPQYLSLSAADYSGIAEHGRFFGFSSATADVLNSHGTPLRRTVHEYSYQRLTGGAPDGRIIKEHVYERRGTSWRPHTFTATTWEWEPLFGGRTYFVHPGSSLTRTCRAGASETACMQQTQDVRRTVETWEGVKPHGLTAVALYVRHAALEGSGIGRGNLDRRTLFKSYEIRYGQPPFAGQDYRVLLAETVKDARRGISLFKFRSRGHTLTKYDANGFPVETHEWADPATEAVTKRTFDPATGNLRSLTKPEQAAPGGSGKQTTYRYDANALFVRTTTNELGHTVTTTHDVATGAVLERAGPNSVMRDGMQVLERETWQIDGLARTVAHAVSFDDPASGYVLHTVDKTTYFDSELPNRIRTQRLLNLRGSVWITKDGKFDGQGRALADIQILDAERTAVTSYGYDSDGKVATVDTPDPRVDDGTQLRTVYKHDGLGRLRRVMLPNRSGVEITYSGLSKTIRETAPDGSGAARRLVYDEFGRLITVFELYPGEKPARTSYHYDSNNNLAAITDADGNHTQLAHDWLNRRVAVTRGGRVWIYRHDLNGNLAAKITPVPAGADPVNHTVTYSRDDLDRVKEVRFFDPGNSQSAGPHHQTVTYTYDQGRNGLGRLANVALGFGEISYGYNSRGLTTVETRAFKLHDIAQINVSQQVRRAYNAAGQLTQSSWDDGQRWRLDYDTRGLVQTVEWYDPNAEKWQPAAEYDYSLAGLLRTRRTSYGQLRKYTYDVLGRIATDTITAPGHDAPIATRSYTYTGSGDLDTVAGASNGHSADATYTYDPQHRLTHATGPSGYTSTFTYTPAGNLHTAQVTSTGPAQDRDVRYKYSVANPQAVKRLVNNHTDETYARFKYDSAGNMTKRTALTKTMTLKWDGLNRLRRAHTDHGEEIYLYDNAGARMLAVSAAGVRFWFSERETDYTLDGVRRRSYLYLSDGASPLARVQNGIKIELQYADSLQNLMLALDSQGKVTANLLYGPYGELVKAAGAADHRRQYNGKEYDAATSLHYYGARYLDSLTLRWNSQDPLDYSAANGDLGEPQLFNGYTFSLNNPLRYYDPDGRSPLDAVPFYREVKYIYDKYSEAKGWIDYVDRAADNLERGAQGESPNINFVDISKKSLEGPTPGILETPIDIALYNMGRAIYTTNQYQNALDNPQTRNAEQIAQRLELQRGKAAATAEAARSLQAHFAELKEKHETKLTELSEEKSDKEELLQSEEISDEQKEAIAESLDEVEQELAENQAALATYDPLIDFAQTVEQAALRVEQEAAEKLSQVIRSQVEPHE